MSVVAVANGSEQLKKADDNLLVVHQGNRRTKMMDLGGELHWGNGVIGG